jgi:hypothetical protein
MSPDWERIARGRQFEVSVCKRLGARLVSRSGAGKTEKSDLKGKFRVSCKAESTKSWNRIREQLKEAIDFAVGTGEIPCLATLDDDGEELVVIRLEDFVKALSDDIKIAPVTTRGNRLQIALDQPGLLRGS